MQFSATNAPTIGVIMRNNFLFLAAISGFSGVALGAFGAHGLANILSPKMLAIYKTGVDYQMWHTLGLGLIANLYRQNPTNTIIIWAGWLMLIGIIIFCGSLYILAISNLHWLGIVAPIGGLTLLSAWALLAISAYQTNANS